MCGQEVLRGVSHHPQVPLQLSAHTKALHGSEAVVSVPAVEI